MSRSAMLDGNNGLLIDYEYCTGCQSCMVACRLEHDYPIGKSGIKVTEVGPWRVVDNHWEWNFIPVPTELCDLCEERTTKGQTTSCALHCLANVIEFGQIDELAKQMKAKGGKVMTYLP